MREPESVPTAEPDWEAFYRDYRKPGYVLGFEITSKLGGGAFGLVFRARKESIGKDYAIKFLKVEDQEVRQAILRELEQVQYLAQVDHPNLVQIEDRGEVCGIPYLVMQFAGGETLRDHMPGGGHAPQGAERDQLMRWFLQACRGVAALHERSLVHFDIKPANVFLKGPVARVGDYGLSKLVTHSRGSLTMGRGTPYYMAPEMLQRRGDQRSDIYSLGVVLYELLCGEPPFTGESEWEVLGKHENEQPSWPDHLTANDRGVIARCMHKNPDARFQRTEELIAALGAPAGVAAAAWEDVRQGAPEAAGSEPPPPLPGASASPEASPRPEGKDPYTGFRDASRDAARHVRSIAKDVANQAKELAGFAASKAKELSKEVQKEHWGPYQRKRRERRRRRAERRAERARARAERRARRRPGAVLGWAVVFAFVILAWLSMAQSPAEAPRVEHSVSSSPTATVMVEQSTPHWSTHPATPRRGKDYLFAQWQVPQSLSGRVSVGEPEWVLLWGTEFAQAAPGTLDRHLAELTTTAAMVDRGRDVPLPRFVFGSPRGEKNLSALLNAERYDDEAAAELMALAPHSLALAAQELRRLDLANAGHLKRARRIQRLLVEATGCEAIPLIVEEGMSRAQVRTANRHLGRLWQWYLHEVAVTPRAWETFREIRAERARPR